MKVVHLDTGRDWRGGQAQVLLLLSGLRARGHESLLLAPRGPLLARAQALKLEARPWRPLGEWDALAALAVVPALARARADLCHCHRARAAVRVVSERPEAHFAWIGEGECRPALERQIRSLDLGRRVHLLGFRDDA